MNVSQTVKVFLVFGALTSYVSNLEEPYRSKAKSYYKKYFTLGNSLWRELKMHQSLVSKDVDIAYDELEEYLMKIIDNALNIPIDDINNYVKHINDFKK